MLTYRKKIILTSIFVHAVVLISLLMYWLFNANIEPEQPSTPQQTQASSSSGNSKSDNTKKSEKIPDTGKNPYADYEEGDLKQEQLKTLLKNKISQAPSTNEEKVKELDQEFDKLSRTSVKEVQKMADLITKASGASTEKSSQPLRELQLGQTLDTASVKLYNYEINEKGLYFLIYKDKNNLYIKNGPHKYEDLDKETKSYLSLLKRANENKKVRILLDATQSILDTLSPPNPPQEK